MARAGDNPKAWGKLLEASNAEDWKTANRIAIKYEFDKDVRERRKEGTHISQHSYFCESPGGEVTEFESVNEIAKYLNIATQAVYLRFHEGYERWERGKLKGWKMWREKK